MIGELRTGIQYAISDWACESNLRVSFYIEYHGSAHEVILDMKIKENAMGLLRYGNTFKNYEVRKAMMLQLYGIDISK